MKLENIKIGMRVFENITWQSGKVMDLWLSEANRPYACIRFEDGSERSVPIDNLGKSI